jgi:pimeloyl-ACP methyl ester carboxylesterase
VDPAPGRRPRQPRAARLAWRARLPNAVFTLPLRSWEQHFTVIQWDHRGAGKTLRRTGKAGSGEMSFDCRVADAVEVIEFLRRYLDKDKVVLLAESMGTLTGTPLVKRRPDLFHAWWPPTCT